MCIAQAKIDAAEELARQKEELRKVELALKVCALAGGGPLNGLVIRCMQKPQNE